MAIRVEGDRATGKMISTITMQEFTMPKGQELTLVKQDGQWRVAR